MKNQIIILLFLGTLFSSCGTTTHYLSSSYDDAIYYNADKDQPLIINSATSDVLTVLKNKTWEAARSNNNINIQEIIYVDDQDSAVIIPEESYEEILTKFDSPYYVINVNVANDRDRYNYWDDPWYDGYYNPWYFRHSIFGPWSIGYSWYGPYDWFYSPYYSYWSSPWYNPWYGGYYGLSIYYGHYGYYDPYDSWYYNGWSGSHFYNPRQRYYGRRDDNVNNSGRGSAISGGSYVRREAVVEQTRGGRLNKNHSESTIPERSESVYRRETRTTSSGAIHNTDVVNGNTNRRETSYQRSNSTYRQPATTNQSQSVKKKTEPVYRRSTQQSASTKKESASTIKSATTATRSTTYERSSTSRTYTTPPASSGNSSSSSSSSRSSSSSSSGSTYRR